MCRPLLASVTMADVAGVLEGLVLVPPPGGDGPLPPDVPVARVEALRRAFDATMKDPAYLAEADKLKIDVEPLSGEQVAALVEQVSRTPADTVARVRAALENR